MNSLFIFYIYVIVPNDLYLWIEMSYFYLKPVKGDMPIHLLEKIVIKRVEYLQNLSNGDSPFYSEYVIEGSVYDNVGHFALCLISALTKSADFTQFFVHAEVILFKQRLSSMSAYDLRCFAKKLYQTIRKLNSNISLIKPLQKLCCHLSIRNIASHVCSASHKEDCIAHSIKLYFKYCLPFVASRQVEMSEGFASIPCGRWMLFLMILYRRGLLHRINQSQEYVHENDPRMLDLLTIVNKMHPVRRDPSMKILGSKDIDRISRYFPPCMLNLHQHLRKKHRLSHDQRFYYSLFLKDIGMPVEEAVDFWKSEYSQPPNGSHNCMHTWAKDEKKLMYGIRHLYGLEGGRKNYHSKNCHQIQNMDFSCQEGGCPFKSFDNANLMRILGADVSDSEPVLAQIFDYKNKKMYSSACLYFLAQNLKTDINCDRNSVNFTPVKYFRSAYM